MADVSTNFLFWSSFLLGFTGFVFSNDFQEDHELLPMVLNTWPVPLATQAAWDSVKAGSPAVESVVQGCTKCEKLQCRGRVGFGGSPDETGEVTLDAMVMNGKTFEVGGVGDLRNVKSAIKVAQAVMDYTQHTLIVGESASKFAIEMGFKKESLETNKSQHDWLDWKNEKCQPNFRKNVTPDPTKSCGPYKPQPRDHFHPSPSPDHHIGPDNHDTIGMVAIDSQGNVASGTSTNGLTHKIPGRVGDSPIPGAGSYASNLGGAAAATGNGDIMMRFLPSFHAVLEMETGTSPLVASIKAITRITKAFPNFRGAVIAANRTGSYAAVCHGYKNFTFCVANPSLGGVKMFTVPCLY